MPVFGSLLDCSTRPGLLCSCTLLLRVGDLCVTNEKNLGRDPVDGSEGITKKPKEKKILETLFKYLFSDLSSPNIRVSRSKSES